MTVGDLAPTTRLGFQAAAAMSAAVVTAHFTSLDRPYWIGLTAIMVLTGSFGENLLRGLDRAGGTIIGLIIGEVYWSAIGGHPAPALAGVVLSVFMLTFAMGGPYRWVVCWVSVALSLLLNLTTDHANLFWARLYDTLLGVIFAGVASALILPQPTGKAVRSNLETALKDGVEILTAMIADLAVGTVRADYLARLQSAQARIDKAAPLLDAARAEAMLAGRGQGRIARRIDLVDRFLRLVTAVAETLGPAATSRVGCDIPGLLDDFARRIAANHGALVDVIETGQRRPMTYLSDLRRRLVDELPARHLDNVDGRQAYLPFAHAIFLVLQGNRLLLELGDSYDIPIVDPMNNAVRQLRRGISSPGSTARRPTRLKRSPV